jgi:hypothetical protein
MNPEFSIGEWVKRRIDQKVGRVTKVEPYDGDFVYYVDLEAEGRRTPVKDDEVWAGTKGAWEPASTLHAHLDGQSQDCDGRYTRGEVYEQTLEERCDPNGWGDLEFKQRVLVSVTSVYAEEATVSITPDGFEYHERTDEGYRAAQVRWCEDTCSDTRSWQRDHRAEEMGY